jgi:hypothetical protein
MRREGMGPSRIFGLGVSKAVMRGGSNIHSTRIGGGLRKTRLGRKAVMVDDET